MLTTAQLLQAVIQYSLAHTSGSQTAQENHLVSYQKLFAPHASPIETEFLCPE